MSTSPDLNTELTNAIIAAHTTLSTQALGSESIRRGLLEVLLGPARLWERLREKGIGDAANSI